MNWLDAMRPEIDATIKAMLARKTFSPDRVFDFDHVKAAVEIVEAAINETQVVAEQVARARAIDAVHRAGTAAAIGQPFSFIEEGTCSHAAVTAKTFFDRLSNIGAQDPRAKSPPR